MRKSTYQTKDGREVTVTFPEKDDEWPDWANGDTGAQVIVEVPIVDPLTGDPTGDVSQSVRDVYSLPKDWSSTGDDDVRDVEKVTHRRSEDARSNAPGLPGQFDPNVAVANAPEPKKVTVEDVETGHRSEVVVTTDPSGTQPTVDDLPEGTVVVDNDGQAVNPDADSGGDGLEDKNVEELRHIASEEDVPGRSDLNKDDLISAIRENRQSSGS